LFWTFANYILEWVICLGMLLVVPRRRNPTSAVAWLLVVFLLPHLGLVLYLMIGENWLPRRRTKRIARLLHEGQSIRRRFRGHPSMVRPHLSPELTSAVTLAERLGFLPILGGNDVELMTETDQVIDRLIDDIEGARHHVHLLFYIFAADATGRRVADALARAVERGVHCRVLVDSVGSARMVKRLAPEMLGRGIEVHEALPVGLFRRRASRFDLRNHRKLAVIDGRIGYTGSQNIVDASYGHKDLAWHDIMARITGPVVLELQAVFLSDWYHETDELLDSDEIFPEPTTTGSVAIQTLPSGPAYPTENYQRMVVAALHGARRHVIITTPYFVPDEPFLQAMQVAVLRGVPVELIVPERYDQIVVGAASRSYYDDLLEHGVRVHLYQSGLLHSKTMTIDGEVAFLGTSNFDIRSFALNFELNLVLYDAEVAGRLAAEQRRYIADSLPLERDAWNRRRWSHKVFQNVARLFSPLL